jgi:two-component system chemotaxis response regulator CheY
MIPRDIKVLIVDDMPTIRDLVKSQLKSLGFKTILEAADGEAALNLLIQHDLSGERVRLIISDWNMPKMSGLDFLKKVRSAEQWSNLPFVLLTSETERDQVTEAILSGVSQYVVKPFTPKAFEEKITSAWQKHVSA